MIASELKAAPERPKLRLVTAADLPPKPAPLFSDHDREWIRAQVRTLTRIYGLEWFLRQELAGHYGLEELADEELRDLFDQFGRAVRCMREGVSFEDAGLIRETYP